MCWYKYSPIETLTIAFLFKKLCCRIWFEYTILKNCTFPEYKILYILFIFILYSIYDLHFTFAAKACSSRQTPHRKTSHPTNTPIEHYSRFYFLRPRERSSTHVGRRAPPGRHRLRALRSLELLDQFYDQHVCGAPTGHAATTAFTVATASLIYSSWYRTAIASTPSFANSKQNSQRLVDTNDRADGKWPTDFDNDNQSSSAAARSEGARCQVRAPRRRQRTGLLERIDANIERRRDALDQAIRRAREEAETMCECATRIQQLDQRHTQLVNTALSKLSKEQI